MLRKLRTSVALLAAATLVAASALPAAADIESDDIVAATPVGVDAFIMRPLGMLTSVIGISMFAVSAPVVLLTRPQDIGKPWHLFVVRPLRYTWGDPLGSH
ncbi:MAG: hypothetical protein MJE66_23885 [Proteobacteria bacterium]|nr:hypothetical protein [Pseudomonadota bacterium]